MNVTPSSSTPVSIFTDIPFAHTPQRTLRLDLRVPKTTPPPPLLMYIPMGGMGACPKENAPWWLVERGFAMAFIEARVSSEAIAPAPVHDCKSAVRWLRAHAGEYGYRPDAIGVWGHSAGGLLSALLGTSGDVRELEGDGPHREMSSRVQAVCDQCGAPHDFAWFARPESKTRFAPVAENLRLYLGGPLRKEPIWLDSSARGRISPQSARPCCGSTVTLTMLCRWKRRSVFIVPSLPRMWMQPCASSPASATVGIPR
jgi:hypothetical protein